jgi:hypothetical protein
MSRRLTNFALLLIWLLAACDSGGLASHPDRGPVKLAFTVQPTDVPAGATLPVVVTVQDAYGNTVVSATTSVTVAIGTNPVGGSLSGSTTVEAVNGVAVFSNLTLDKPGAGYTLTANANALAGTTSSPFNVVVPVFVISGRITSATGGLGVSVDLTGAVTASTTPDADGNYAFAVQMNGTYTVTPSKPSYRFHPRTSTVTVNGGDVGGVNFFAGSPTAWTSVPSGTTNNLIGVWGSGPNDVWAVGRGGTILHWNDSAWTAVPSSTTANLFGVWGSGPNDVWATGGGTILHWNGSAWSSVSSGTSADLLGVWGSGPNDVWAVGDLGGTIVHWNGSAWSSVPSGLPSGTTDYLYGVWGSGPSDVWAVGGDDIASTILHWNGGAWTPVEFLGGNESSFRSVWGSGPNDVWAFDGFASVVHWNGSAWSESYFKVGGPLSVWGSGPNDVWAVGWSGSMVHWDGSAWSSVASGTTNILWGVWGSGPNDVWAVGAGGTILLSPGG